MPAETRNITIEQGATFRMNFVWREGTKEEPGDPISLEGATVRMQIRKDQQAPILLEATTGDGITTGGIAGTVSIVLPPAKTNLLAVRSCKYDVEAVFAEDDVHRLLKGRVTVDPNITQNAGDPVVGR